jgi:valyl-tRNA synthetase
MPLGGLIDAAVEKARIAKDVGTVDKEIATLEKKLGNADFLARAPEDVVEEQRVRLAEEQTRRQRLALALETLAATAGEV